MVYAAENIEAGISDAVNLYLGLKSQFVNSPRCDKSISNTVLVTVENLTYPLVKRNSLFAKFGRKLCAL
jgi:hypothetical protein